MTENDGLKREIGVWGLVSNSINIVVGAGIFVLPAIVAEQLGTASVLAYAICGVLIVLIMLCFAEIGSRITVTGGAYAYVEVAFGRYCNDQYTQQLRCLGDSSCEGSRHHIEYTYSRIVGWSARKTLSVLKDWSMRPR